MKINRIFLLILILCTPINYSYSYDNNLVFTGDSITWALGQVTESQRFSRLATQSINSYLGTSYTEVNTGISGTCLSNFYDCVIDQPLVERINSNITDFNARYIFIESPINDANNVILTPVSEYEADYRTIIETIEALNPTSTIVLMNWFYPVHGQFNNGESVAMVGHINELIYNLSVEYDVLYVNITNLISPITSYSNDGLHYNTVGHSAVAAELLNVVKFPANYSNTNFSLITNRTYPTSLKIKMQVNSNRSVTRSYTKLYIYSLTSGILTNGLDLSRGES